MQERGKDNYYSRSREKREIGREKDEGRIRGRKSNGSGKKAHKN